MYFFSEEDKSVLVKVLCGFGQKFICSNCIITYFYNPYFIIICTTSLVLSVQAS